jgi:perosamine synthetase
MTKLALFGGPKTIVEPFIRYKSIGKEETAAVLKVLEGGILSKFLGCWDPDFYGGEQIQAFEKEWALYFGVKHAVTVNSNTSGLIAAIGSLGIEPGDEIIVSPWTMCATATSILVWNAIPVFADIEPETYNLDPASIKSKITPYTKAIIVTDIFGHAADLEAIMDIAQKNKLKVIEDCAQAPGAFYKKKYVGTIADIGIFSLNYHKHIHTGEGGVCVTNNSNFAERIQLIRNHAEAVVGDKGVSDLSNMIGFNFRMTEIEAAIGREQLKKLAILVEQRIRAANRLTEGLLGLKGVTLPIVKQECTHVYYVYPIRYQQVEVGVCRDRIVEALIAEGVSVSNSYANLHLLPLFQKKQAFGKNGFPWSASFYKGTVSYKKGICPVAESLNDSEYIGIGMCEYSYSDEQIDLMITAFHKVWGSLDLLRAQQVC